MTLLSISNLIVSLKSRSHLIHAVRDVDLSINPGECTALVGESGSGKSVLAQSILGLIPDEDIFSKTGSLQFKGAPLLAKHLPQIRGNQISMIFQDPFASLNPTMKVGYQVAESLVLHQKISWKKGYQQACQLLGEVGFPNPKKYANMYPFALSGGMRQRALIAGAIACSPALLIADEPTTALDQDIQIQILNLLKQLQKERNMALLLITHDLAAVTEACDTIHVMYAGKIIEKGTVEKVLKAPSHPYTEALLNAIPNLDHPKTEPLRTIPGHPPNLRTPPPACPFHPRCPYAMEICQKKSPPFEENGKSQWSSCWLHHPLSRKRP